MASLAASAVTINRSFVIPSGGGNLVMRTLTLVLTGQGGTTNTIPASVLEFQEIISCSNAVKSDNSEVLPAAPNAAGSAILIADDGADTPGDETGTYNITVTGFSKSSQS